MEHQEQLSWEARVGRIVAIAAFAAAAFLVAAIAISSSAQSSGQDLDTTEVLFLVHDNKSSFLLGSILQGLSTIMFAPVLWFLYRVIRYRREEVPAVARYLAIAAPLLSGLVFIINRVQVSSAASRVRDELLSNPRPPGDANDFARDELTTSALQTIGGLGLAGGLAMGLVLVLLGINAMRSGVLSRFMGILGVIVGVLLVLPIFGNVPFVQIFWVLALGLLFLDRWPQGGRGPAWETGEAIPWPTAADRAARMAEERADREAERDGKDADVERDRPRVGLGGGRRPAPEPVEVDEDDGHAERRQAASHPRSKKRKRKRR